MNFRKTNRIAVLLLLRGSQVAVARVARLCATPKHAVDKLGITVE